MAKAETGVHPPAQPTRLPLEGLRVLDLSRLIPGPFATKLLQDMGAQVDKLEDPRVGDYLRSSPPLGPLGLNPAFELLNRGKRSFTLDLKSDQGRATMLRLLTSYDVLLESFRPGVMTRLGFGPKLLRAFGRSRAVRANRRTAADASHPTGGYRFGAVRGHRHFGRASPTRSNRTRGVARHRHE